MRLAVILVHYHTPELAVAAVEALRADLAGTALEVEWLLIDNGSDARGRELLARLPVELIDPGSNLGYAGGVNLGMARSRSEMAVVMNPDVHVLPGCLPALLDCLHDEAAVAGPRFYWDCGRRLVQPPAEVRTRREELLRLLAGKSPWWAAQARRRWRWHARRHWEAREPLPSHALSGSLLALRRSAWEAVGPFDEGYRLYFEETDWLLRARRQGLAARYVPDAEAVHLYSRSASREPRAEAWFEESAQRFRSRHYGPRFVGLLQRLDRGSRGSGGPAQPSGSAADAHTKEVSRASQSPLTLTGLELPKDRSAYPLWIEVSPNLVGFPAAAERLTEPPVRPWKLPAEIEERLAGSELTVRVISEDGRELLQGCAGGSLRGAA
jgi:N-acetylglucosaminyl-diphospho-decaprenol L-rhamnosyltransferase